MRWLPKPTPYRVLVISTTISLGTAKAYATAKGFSLIATSIEWITGVIVFSIFFVLNFFQDDPPRSLSWFMQSDLLADVFCRLSLPPPRYRTDELLDQGVEHIRPPITGYQILTTVTIALIGTSKAYLSYRQLSPASNALDWVLGVFVTSCLYILGLYEKNPSNYMPYLFSTNYSTTLYQISLRIAYVIGILILSPACIGWYQIGQWPTLPPIFPPSLLTALGFFCYLVYRVYFYIWLLSMGGATLFMSGLLLHPLWFSPPIRKIVAVLRRLVVWMEDRFDEIPRRTREYLPDVLILSALILFFSSAFLISGYLSVACISDFRSLWHMKPKFIQLPLPTSAIYILKYFSLFCLILGTLSMFVLDIASLIFLIVALVSIFHSGCRRAFLRR